MKTITFLIPVYNEEERLAKTFKALREVKLPKELSLTEVIFVNDGSTDSTVHLIEKAARTQKRLPHIKLVTYTENKGKGYAIRHGMTQSTADYTLFFDADMSTPLSELQKLLPSMEKGFDVIVGTRKNGKSTVVKHQPLYREVLGRGFTKLTQLMLGINVTDFTCGFKAFSKKARRSIFTDAQINGWGYDAELLFLAKQHSLSMQEVPVIWSNDDRSKVKLYKDVPKSFLDLVTILWIHQISWYALLLPRSVRLFFLQKYAA